MQKRKKVSILLILIGIIYFFQYNLNIKIDYYKHIKIIDNYNRLNKYSNILGYIEFKNVKREIIIGITKENLNKEVVTSNKDLDEENIILAGHNISNVFRQLYDLKLGDKVFVVSKIKEDYVVEKITIVQKNYKLNKSDLTLITCTNDNQNRLVIYLKKIT